MQGDHIYSDKQPVIARTALERELQRAPDRAGGMADKYTPSERSEPGSRSYLQGKGLKVQSRPGNSVSVRPSSPGMEGPVDYMLRALIDECHSPVLVLELGRDFRCLFANKAWSRSDLPQLADRPSQDLQELFGWDERVTVALHSARDLGKPASWTLAPSQHRAPKGLWTCNVLPVSGEAPASHAVLMATTLSRERVMGGLSRREWQVAQLVAEGQSNVQIGRRLFLSPATVASHVQSILRKLDLRSRVQIAVWSVEQRLAG